MKQYKATLMKYTEADTFKDGCDPKSGTDHGIVFECQKSDLAGINHVLKTQTCFDVSKAEAYEERLEFSVLEDAEGNEATKDQIARWSKGTLVLYNASYSLYLQSVESFELKAALLQGRE